MSAASRQVWISITSSIVATMIILGIVGWNGGHPYYWAIVVILTVSCVLACKKLGPRQQSQRAASREPHDVKDGSKQLKGA
jgi:hypothetical protein